MTKMTDVNKKEEIQNKEPEKDYKEKVLKELEKEIKTTITDSTTKFREELKEEMFNDIQVEVANTLRQEEKKLLRNKTNSIWKRDAIIAVFLVICLYFGYCLYDVKYFDFMKSECEKNGTCGQVSGNYSNPDNPNEQKPAIVKDKNWYLENYGYLLKNVQVRLDADYAKAYYLYSDDFSLSDIKAAYLLNMAYGHLDKKVIKSNSLSITVDGESMRKAFNDLFGSTTYYQNVNFSYNCLDFVYNQDKDKFVASNTKCSASKNKIIEEIQDMYEEGEVLYMQTVAAIYNDSEKSFYTFDDLYDAAVTNVTEEDLSKNFKKLNRYQYQFKKVDDVYYLNSITKLK